MKQLKVLTLIFGVTLLCSTFGVYAYGTTPLQISNVKVGGADDSTYHAAGRTKIREGYQTVTGINVSRSLKTQLQYYNTALNKWMAGGVRWYPMNTNENIRFETEGATSYYPSMVLGDYKIDVKQSSYSLTDATLFSATHNPGN